MEYFINPDSNFPAVSNHVQVLNDLFPVLKEELQLAQVQMKSNADKFRKDHALKVGDLAGLLTRNIKSLRPSAKLDHKRLTNKINEVTFDLDLRLFEGGLFIPTGK